MNDWPFDQAPNVAAITTQQVLQDGLPILNVVHYSEDHSWAFTCGTSDAVEDGRVIGMGQALRRDPTLASIADLPPGGTPTAEPSVSPGPSGPTPTIQSFDNALRRTAAGGGLFLASHLLLHQPLPPKLAAFVQYLP